MTETQKQNISVLRQQGFTFGQIAKEVDMSVNTVKSYFRRLEQQCKNASYESKSKDNKEIKNKDEVRSDTCKNCRHSLVQRPKAKPKQFCCDACRIKWWNAQRKRLTRDGMITTPCACCGTLFVSYKSMNRRFCCHACYVRARFKKEVVYDY